MSPEEEILVIHRLRTACGHLDAIVHMVEKGDPCEEILRQLSAVQAATREIGLSLLKKEMFQYTQIILSNDCSEERVGATQRVLELYELFFKKPIKPNMEQET